MEMRSQTSRFGHDRRTPLRLCRQFHRERPKSLRRVHRQAKTCCAHPQWRGDQGPRLWLLINYEEIENEFSIEIVRTSNCCAYHRAGIGWWGVLVGFLEQTGMGRGT